jgi:Uma2 family endonuclease
VLPLSVKAYHALGEMGLIQPRTELLYGQIYQKMSKSPLHSFLSEYLEEALRACAVPGCHVRGEEALTLSDSEPEPDVAVVRGRREDYRHTHPSTAEFVIEVSVSSHDFDRSKLRAYAEAGIKEVWLVLAPEQQIEVYGRPLEGHYAEKTVHGPGGSVSSPALPGFAVDLEALFSK